MDHEPDATDLLDAEPEPASTAAPGPLNRWTAAAAGWACEFARAMLRYPIVGKPLRPVSLPGYPTSEIYFKGFDRACRLMRVWWASDCSDDERYDPQGLTDDEFRDLMWSRGLLDHLVDRFGWRPWIQFHRLADQYYVGDDAHYEYERRQAEGPYVLTDAEALALRAVRRRLLAMLRTHDVSRDDEEDLDEADDLVDEDPEAAEAKRAFERSKPAQPEPSCVLLLVPPEGLPVRADGRLMLIDFRDPETCREFYQGKPVALSEAPDDAVVVPASTALETVRVKDVRAELQKRFG